MNSVEDDLDELKSLQTKLHRLGKTYIDSVIVKANTKFLLTSRNLSGTEEKNNTMLFSCM